MELDKRILPGKRPLGCFDTEEAKEFLGEKGYFCNNLSRFCYLNSCSPAYLRNIFVHDESCFEASRIDWPNTNYKYFLPAEWLKPNPEEPENKWRPFTLDEFIDRFDLELGTRVFLIRYKTHPEHQKRLLLTGLIHDKDPGLCGVCLGGFQFTFSDLFDMFDVRFGENDWQPFGVEEASE